MPASTVKKIKRVVVQLSCPQQVQGVGMLDWSLDVTEELIPTIVKPNPKCAEFIMESGSSRAWFWREEFKIRWFPKA